MNLLDSSIEQARHIVLHVCAPLDADGLGSASALYTYVLTLHKKATLVCNAEIPPRLRFIPWVDQVRTHLPQSADVCIDISPDQGVLKVLEVFDFLRAREVKINVKMATALYGGLLESLEGFRSPQTDARALHVAAELLERGADAKAAVRFLFEMLPLSHLRLKALLLLEMQLACDAQLALLCVTRAHLQRSGASEGACEAPLREALCLPSVACAVLLVEREDGGVGAELRTKSLDARVIAEGFGGVAQMHRATFELTTIGLEAAVEMVILHVKDRLETK
ncbi:MAG: hypothetical protein JXK05_11575 [Campylobacterales bacterium]|nr:hypothetical protein [Campylobacterales bacterium]